MNTTYAAPEPRTRLSRRATRELLSERRRHQSIRHQRRRQIHRKIRRSIHVLIAREIRRADESIPAPTTNAPPPPARPRRASPRRAPPSSTPPFARRLAATRRRSSSSAVASSTHRHRRRDDTMVVFPHPFSSHHHHRPRVASRARARPRAHPPVAHLARVSLSTRASLDARPRSTPRTVAVVIFHPTTHRIHRHGVDATRTRASRARRDRATRPSRVENPRRGPHDAPRARRTESSRGLRGDGVCGRGEEIGASRSIARVNGRVKAAKGKIRARVIRAKACEGRKRRGARVGRWNAMSPRIPRETPPTAENDSKRDSTRRVD